MPTFRLRKLVRDKFVAIYEDMGQKPVWRLLPRDEHTTALAAKVAEESQELVAAAPDKLASEIADIEQALDDLKALHGITEAEIAKIKRSKNKQKGGFAKGLYIDTLTLDENDPWVEYYRKEPKRFPEIS